MHLMVCRAIAFDPENDLGVCVTCGTPLTERRGLANLADCIAQIYCPTCQKLCAESPVIDDIRQVPSLLAARGKLTVGNVGGLSAPLKRLLER